MIKIVQSWDDGVIDDIRLTELLRQFKAHADFNLTPSFHQESRKMGWMLQDKEIWYLSIGELLDIYKGFDIGAHSMTHPNLTELDKDTLSYEVIESKKTLETLFNSSIPGFCYPFNAYNDTVIETVKNAGFVYARGIEGNISPQPASDPFQFSPNVHFLDEHFWEKYQNVKSRGEEVFYFWGHSYELLNDAMWEDFVRKLETFAKDETACFCRMRDVFETSFK